MSVDAKDNPFSVSHYRAAALDVFFEHSQSLTINGQCPLATMFLLLSLSLLNLTSALWAKGMASAESLSATGTGQLQAGFKVLDSDGTAGEVYVLDRQSQGLADAATKME